MGWGGKKEWREGGREGGEVAWPPKAFWAVRGGTKSSIQQQPKRKMNFERKTQIALHSGTDVAGCLFFSSIEQKCRFTKSKSRSNDAGVLACQNPF